MLELLAVFFPGLPCIVVPSPFRQAIVPSKRDVMLLGIIRFLVIGTWCYYYLSDGGLS